MKKKEFVLPVQRETKTKISKPLDTTVGMSAVQSSFAEGFSQMDWLKCSKALLNLNQAKGFDCPGCAWPDPLPGQRSSIGEYCENGAKAVAEEATEARVTPEFFAQYNIEEMQQWSERKLGKSGRITHPMILREGALNYEPISWENAFRYIADELNKLTAPDEAVFYTSGRTSNEAAFLYQLFARQFGTNNLPDCSNLCHESTGIGLSQTIGIGKGTVKLEDFYQTDLIIVMGQNPGTNHPRMLTALQKAKRNGAKIICINPLEEAAFKKFKNPQEIAGWLGGGTRIADLFLQVKINGDLALLKAIMYLLYEREKAAPGSVFNTGFIQEHTEGLEDFLEELQKQNFSHLVSQSGISEEEIYQAAELVMDNKKMIICWAMGITQHENGVDNVKEIVNLLLLRGSIGIPGGGACPVRGHSNVQGDRTMGIWEHLKPAFKEKLEKTFQFSAPDKTGYNAVNAIRAMYENKVRVFFSLGGNLLLAGPDTEYTAKGMRNCDLTVMVSTKPNRNHLVTGKTAIILPCIGRTEKDLQVSGLQFVSVENSMGVVHQSRGILPPASDNLLSEPMIIAHLAKATLGDKTAVEWIKLASNYDLIRDKIAKCIPGFEKYNERVRRKEGFYLPNGPREQHFSTASGKAHFTVNQVPVNKLKKGSFLMTTIRSHDQFNTTVYGNDDRYRGISNGRRIALMNKKDLAALNLKQGDFIDLMNHHGGLERVAPLFMVVAYDLPEQSIATYFPEANVLVPIDQYARESYTPASKSVVVTLRRSEEMG